MERNYTIHLPTNTSLQDNPINAVLNRLGASLFYAETHENITPLGSGFAQVHEYKAEYHFPFDSSPGGLQHPIHDTRVLVDNGRSGDLQGTNINVRVTSRKGDGFFHRLASQISTLTDEENEKRWHDFSQVPFEN